jgi:hypothetical protein
MLLRLLRVDERAQTSHGMYQHLDRRQSRCRGAVHTGTTTCGIVREAEVGGIILRS